MLYKKFILVLLLIPYQYGYAVISTNCESLRLSGSELEESMASVNRRTTRLIGQVKKILGAKNPRTGDDMISVNDKRDISTLMDNIDAYVFGKEQEVDPWRVVSDLSVLNKKLYSLVKGFGSAIDSSEEEKKFKKVIYVIIKGTLTPIISELRKANFDSLDIIPEDAIPDALQAEVDSRTPSDKDIDELVDNPDDDVNSQCANFGLVFLDLEGFPCGD